MELKASKHIFVITNARLFANSLISMAQRETKYHRMVVLRMALVRSPLFSFG